MARRRQEHGRRVTLALKVSEPVFARVEVLRGGVPVSEWLRGLVDEAIARADAEAGNGSASGADVTDAMVEA